MTRSHSSLVLLFVINLWDLSQLEKSCEIGLN